MELSLLDQKTLRHGQANLSFSFLTMVRNSLYSPMAAWIFLGSSSLVMWSLYEMYSILRYHLISNACFLFSSSESRSMIHGHSKNLEMIREHISFIFDPRDMLLSLHIGVNFVRAAVLCPILNRNSGFELQHLN